MNNLQDYVLNLTKGFISLLDALQDKYYLVLL